MPQFCSGLPRALKPALLLLLGVILLVACGESPADSEPRPQVTILDSAGELVTGESFWFSAVAQTAEGLSNEITWSSADPGVAAVEESGLVTGVAPGTTTITARSVLKPVAYAEVALTVTAAVEHAARLHYLEPADFEGNLLNFELPPSEVGRTVLIVSPDLDTTDYVQRNQYVHDQHYEFTVTTGAANPGADAALKPLPQPPALKPEDWAMNYAAGNPLPDPYQFSVWSQVDEAYVAVTGTLAYVSENLAFYEDSANTSNFTQAEYETISSLVDDNFPELTRLMGEPTDLDGNGKIKVFISTTMMDIRTFGEAYVDGCHMFDPLPQGCSGPGEFIYIAALDYFGVGAEDARDFFVTDYYPGNILHEAVHLLQFAHAYRRFDTYMYYNAPAYLSEGQAELIKFLTGISASRNWQQVADNLRYPQPERQSPWLQPYQLGGPLFLFLHEYGGEGFSQALMDRMYDFDHRYNSLIEPILSVPEPLLYAAMYGALLFDGTMTGQQTGLQFRGFDIATEMEGVRPRVALLSEVASASTERTFTGAAVFEITHTESVWVQLESVPEGAYVLVVTPAE